MFKWLRFIYNSFTSSKYKRDGYCSCCGECCRKIVLTLDGQVVNTNEQYEELKRRKRKYYHFEFSSIDDDGNYLFKCKSLGDDNKCKDYFFRSLYCRKYPDIDKKFIMAGGKLLDNCTYRIKPDKEFIDYLE